MTDRRRATDRDGDTKIDNLVHGVATLAGETKNLGDRFDRFHSAMWGNSQPGFVKDITGRVAVLETFQSNHAVVAKEREKRETWKLAILGLVISALVLATKFL